MPSINDINSVVSTVVTECKNGITDEDELMSAHDSATHDSATHDSMTHETVSSVTASLDFDTGQEGGLRRRYV